MKLRFMALPLIFITGCDTEFMNNPPPKEEQIEAMIVHISPPELPKHIAVEYSDDIGKVIYVFQEKSSGSLKNPKVGDCVKIWVIKVPF